jgi:hypothetical protein
MNGLRRWWNTDEALTCSMENPMPKANHALSTSTPEPKSRRAVILGAGGIAALCATSAALATAADPSSEHQSLIAEIRRLHATHYALVDHEMSIEVRESDPGYPAYEAAIAENRQTLRASPISPPPRSLR